MKKLQSRKFWLCVAAALASLGTGISGLVQGNDKLALVGGILLVISSSIYAFCEAWIDSKAIISYDEITRFIEELLEEKEGEQR